MAVYTALSHGDAAALLDQYDIGAPLSLKPIAEGVENTNYSLLTPAGRFVLTIFEQRVAEADVPFFIALMAHLAQSGFPAPQPVAAKSGACLTRAKGKPAAIVTFLDGAWPRSWNAVHCAAIGEALARMHVALQSFAPARANTLGPAGWEALIRPRLPQAQTLQPGLAAALTQDIDAVRAAWPSDLPRGAIHADLFPDNALFDGERLCGVIDFYFACTDFLAYDLAVCLNAWCFSDERDYDLERGRAMIGAYEAVRPLSDAERAELPVLARGAALRFFATRLADWSATPGGALVQPKDPLEYARKLAFHRAARGASDYGA
ncbi:MAG: homoserine kinase [Hyphomonadaceae bacterium]